MNAEVILVNTNSTDMRTFLEYSDWRYALGAATEVGWSPRGTRAPAHLDTRICCSSGEPSHWSGSYVRYMGEVVTERDAQQLGSALEELLKMVPDCSPSVCAPSKSRCWECEPSHQSNVVREAVVHFASRREVLAGLVEFCKRGGFRVYDFPSN